MMNNRTSLVVFSHLRWDFVFQRPQHLMSRLAATRPVLFIEEPVFDPDGPPRWELREPIAGVTVCQPITTVDAPGFDEAQIASLRLLVSELLTPHAKAGFDLWFYTPMALPLADGLEPRLIAYDCMDELSSFRFAPSGLLELERQLLDRANVVFTGGPSLYQKKRGLNANCHCFPSSVDVGHFSQTGADPDEQACIPQPRLGYFGVIDERFDLDLLGDVARARPQWQFVMVGPIVKIDEAALPREANIHYLGMKSYAELPGLLSGWDVALLPFALNEATRYISPTKTLEYMAAGKPIVSTPITDVAVPYGNIVRLADDAASFIDACEKALAENDDERRSRLENYHSILSRTSWDSAASAMAELLDQTAARACETAAISDTRPLESHATVIVGAGPTGLSAAYHLGPDSLLIEANDTVGGWCRSIVDQGFTFDFAGHIMFSNDPYVHELYDKLLGYNVHWQDREAWIRSKDVYTRYPFQGSLYGLPADVIKECIVGAVEARYGIEQKAAAQPPAGTSNGNGHAQANGNGHTQANGHAHTNGNGHTHSNGNGNGNGHANGNGNGNGRICQVASAFDPKDDDTRVEDCCGDGVMESTAPLRDQQPSPVSSEPSNFEEFIYKVWGAGIAKHFAVSYNRKIWAVPLDEMETSWLGGRVPMPDLGEMIEGALSPKPKPMGPNARFGYPLRGGFQALMDGFTPLLQGELRLNTRVRAVSPSRHLVTLGDGTTIHYEQLVSTMPLPALIRAMGDEAPAEVRRAAAALRHTSVRCVNLGIGRENITEKHWIYYPEETVFHRIFVQGNASPHCNPPGGFGLTCEITYSPSKPLPCDGDVLIKRCFDDCVSEGLLRADDPIWAANQVDMPYAYVVYDHARPANIALIREWLERHDILLAGRYSEWEYYNSDHAFLAGRRVAEEVAARRRTGAAAHA